MSNRAARLVRRWALSVLLVPVVVATAAAQPPEGYRDYERFRRDAEQLAASGVVSLDTLDETAEGRDVLLLTVSAGDPSEKPAVLVVGSVEADSLVGSHLAMALVRELSERAAADPAINQLLNEAAFYVIPRPSPDASERLFASPLVASAANSRPRDDDRDGEVDEDPPEDLNGDGLITKMRVADPAGGYRVHPEDPRVMIKADPTKGEHGTHRLLVEGVDSDGDEQWNEDGPGGVDFNRNFTFRYPYFKPGAGPHQVSEPETRAVAEFAYDHANIFLVLSFAPQDNLNHPWKTKSSKERIKRAVQGDDAKHLERIAERYAELLEPKDVPESVDGEGAFVPWAYFHYGRWSVASRGWWPPKAEADASESESSEEEPDADDSADQKGADQKRAGQEEAEQDKASDKASTDGGKSMNNDKDKRGEEDVRALRWFDSQGIDGFADWREHAHPDFPGKLVEIGGFKPSARTHPPVEELDAAPWADFLAGVAKDRARLELLSAEATPLGEGVVRVEAEVVNRGKLPTASEMGQTSRRLRRLMVELIGPEGLRVLAGPRRQDLGVLAPGGAVERSWLVLLPEGVSPEGLRVRAGEPSVGFVETGVVQLEESP